MWRHVSRLFGDIRAAHVFVALPFSVFAAAMADADTVRLQYAAGYLAVLAAAWLLANRCRRSPIVAALLWLAAASGPLWAWATVRNRLTWLPGLAAVALLLWLVGTESLYSAQEPPYGDASALCVVLRRIDSHIAAAAAATFHIFFVVALVALGVLGGLGRGFVFTIAFAVVVTTAQHHIVHKTGACRSWPAAFLTNAFCSCLLCLSAL